MTTLTLRERRTAETRQLILDAAASLFASRGYGQTSVDSVIAEAGLSKGAFYHHFAGKEALLAALLEDRQRRCAEQMQGAVTPASSLREAVDRLVKASFETNEADPDGVRLYFEFCLQAMRDPAARDVVARSLAECREMVAGMLKIGQPGAVRGDLDTDAAATLLIALFDGIALHRAIAAEAVDLRVIARPSGDLIERFVANGDTSPRQSRKGGSR
ncbi:MAG: TetR/AcrR family transcriptional regulator [Dehalococcoidia bacterium]